MKRSVVTILAAAAAVVAFSGSASATTAGAATTFRYSSANHRALVKGTFTRPQPGFHIYGLSFKLSDRDFRPAERGGKCAYVEINYGTPAGGPTGGYTTSYTQCGTDKDKQISSGIVDLQYLNMRICQIGTMSSVPVNCGPWHRLYTSSGANINDRAR